MLRKGKIMPRIWVTITKETKEFLDQKIAKKRFHNYSHAVDFIITRFMERQKKGS